MTRPLIRVLHVAGSLGLGGTEKVMQHFATGLDRDRFQAAVHSPTDGERGPLLRETGIPTHIGPDLLRTIETFAPHIVHLHRAGWPDPDSLRPLRGARVPVVVETNVFGRHDPTPVARRIDCHLFVSEFCARRFERATGIAAQWPRYGVLYNPVDTDRFAAAPAPDFSRPTIGRISRPDPGKWSPLALEFLPALAAQFPDLRYHIIGAIPEALKYIRSHALERHVVLHEPVTTDAQIADFLSSVAVLAHANDTGESFGLVIAEAMACGLPVVTHPAEGERDNAQLELVEHGVTGLVARTADEYAGALAWLLRHPDEARAMGARGREKAARLYRVQTVVAGLEDIYERLLAAKTEVAGTSGHAAR